MIVVGRSERGTEIEIIKTQEQALQTKYHTTKILQTETDSKCRLCRQFDDRVQHLLSACPILAKEQYIKRHDGMCVELHFNKCKEIRVKLDNEHRCGHLPKSFEHVMKVRLPYYGTNKCEPTELLLTINRTSYSMIITQETDM